MIESLTRDDAQLGSHGSTKRAVFSKTYIGTLIYEGDGGGTLTAITIKGT
jgi:hypothetical protein